MREAEELIRIWHVTEDGGAIPLDAARAEEELESLCPEYSGRQLLHALVHCGLVEEDPGGRYLLTGQGVRERLRTCDAVAYGSGAGAGRGHEWDRFRKVLGYYIDCIRSQEQPQEYLRIQDFNRTFIVPELPARWLCAPGTDPEVAVPVSEEQRPAVQRLAAMDGGDAEIYLGYPLAACAGQADREPCYTPVGLLPVDILYSGRTVLRIRIRTAEAEINLPWLELACPPEERNGILGLILQLHADDRFSGVIDLLNALPLLGQDSMRFDPDRCETSLHPLGRDCRQAMFNTPVLFLGQPLHYSKNLKQELKHIRDRVPDEILDTTALSCVFREPPLEPEPPRRPLMPLPFIESNPEQMSAVEAALNLPLTRITGPPGTGKSQVAVNIIANQIFNGRTVLFSSRNHKAVETIYKRSRQILPEPGLALMNFCTRDDPNPWYAQNLDLLLAEAGVKGREFDDDQLFRVEMDVERWRDIARRNAPRGGILSEYERIRRRIAGIRRRIRILTDSERAADLSPEEFALLESHVRSLARPPSLAGDGLLPWLGWRLRGRRRDRRAREFLRRNYPEQDLDDLEDLRKLFRSFAALHRRCRELTEQGRTVEDRARALPSLEAAERRLGGVFGRISASLHQALLICRVRRIDELNDDPALVARLKDIMSFVRGSRPSCRLPALPPEEAARAEDGFRMFSRYYPGWAVSLLSLPNASPCVPGLFDSVIIDEASQCDPACVIPALFRGRTAVLMGDTCQFPPVITLRQMRNDYLKRRNGIVAIADQRFDFLNTSAFALSSATPILLREHFRCSEEIAGYFNEVFYGNRLLVRTDREKLNFPACLNLGSPAEWIDVRNSNAAEFDAVERILTTLSANAYSGTVGVISPFKQYAEALRRRLYPVTSRWPGNQQNERVLIDTANGFQGDERDVIVFVLGYNDALTRGRLWYLEAPENRYVYNVAVSRARACLILVGDRERCRNSPTRALQRLALIPPPDGGAPRKDGPFESPWERRLHQALRKAGIETLPQYPLMGRRLDLALIRDDRRIDIEVDGIHCHLDQDGFRRMDDLYRDLQVNAAGWQVKRFWVYELRDDLPRCVREIQEMLG